MLKGCDEFFVKIEEIFVFLKEIMLDDLKSRGDVRLEILVKVHDSIWAVENVIIRIGILLEK